MKKNVGSIDKVLRLLLALGLFSLFFLLEGNARYWAIVGVVPLTTGPAEQLSSIYPFGVKYMPPQSERISRSKLISWRSGKTARFLL